MTQPTVTDWIAIYAAIVATLVFIWDIVKWLKTGAKLRIHTRNHVSYEDSRIIKTIQTENGEIRELAEYCHIEVSNIGDQPTTILGIEATHQVKRNAAVIGHSGSAFIAHFGKTLPQVLKPGEVWSARIEMPRLYQLAERGQPVVLINTSKSKSPIKTNIKLDKVS